MKAKRAAKGASSLVLETEDEQRQAIESKLREEQENENNVLSQEVLEIMQKGGTVAVQEAILKEVEKKHSMEIKVRRSTRGNSLGPAKIQMKFL